MEEIVSQYYLVFRFLIVFLVVCFLSQSGSLLQLIFANPLASASTLGINALGVVLFLMAFGIQFLLESSDSMTFLNIEALEAAHIGFLLWMVLAAIFAIYFRQTQALKHSPLKHSVDLVPPESSTDKLILLGLAVNLGIAAVFSLLQFVLLAKGQSFSSRLWFGQINYFSSFEIFSFLPVGIFGCLFLGRLGRQFAGLGLGRPWGIKSLGQNQHVSVALFGIVFINLLVTLYFGVFSFIGLVLPHLFRQGPWGGWFRQKLSRELGWGAGLGGLLAACADQCLYHFPVYGTEIPLGLVSAIVGPFVLAVLTIQKLSFKRVA